MKISICDIINISSIIQNKEKYKSRVVLRDRRHCCSDFSALVRTIPDTSKSAPLFAFNDEKAELALTLRSCNVATLRRRDVEALRHCILLTFILVDPTSRRWDVTTWGRRDVGTSRRSSHPYALPSSALKLLPKAALFAPIAPAYTLITKSGIQPQKLRK